ncbi:unnamed protein product, partial [Meganyctiphanes norvegica]
PQMYETGLVLVLVGLAGAQFASVQTFGSGNGGSGAAESRHTRPDGVTEGECAYSNAKGQQVKVRYEERGGVLLNVKSSVPSDNAQTQLTQCRAEAAKINQNLQGLQNSLFQQQQNLFSNLPFMAGVLPAAFPGAGAGAGAGAFPGAGAFAGGFAGGQNGGFASVGGNFGNGLPQTEAFGSFNQQGAGAGQGTPNFDVVNVRSVSTGVNPGGNTGSSNNFNGVYGSSGVSISNAIGNDGVSRGQCAYTDGTGNTIKINIAESPSGETNIEVIHGNPLKSNEYFAECQRLSGVANEQARVATAHGQEQARQAQQQVAAQTAGIQQQLAAQHAAIMQQHQNLMQNLQNQIPFFNGRR